MDSSPPILRMQLLQDDNPELHGMYERFAENLDPLWRRDLFLMTIMFAIALFNPRRSGIIEIEHVGYADISTSLLLLLYNAENNIYSLISSLI